MKQKILTILIVLLSISAGMAQDSMPKIIDEVQIDEVELSSLGYKLCLGDLSGSVTLYLCVDETGVDKYFEILAIKLYKNLDTVLMYRFPQLDTTLGWHVLPVFIEDFPNDVQYYYPFIAEYVSNLKVKFRNREKFERTHMGLRIKVECD
ncbi:hypothetical protein FACS1894178_9340 [Bacteroidia bacterium]|nr:hypothetical protein FACS1894178_9340 [Bacteroidia bacterium]